jgi:hypothetical protein
VALLRFARRLRQPCRRLRAEFYGAGIVAFALDGGLPASAWL